MATVDSGFNTPAFVMETTARQQLTFTEYMQCRSADKSLARPGSKQATAPEGFDVHISYL